MRSISHDRKPKQNLPAQTKKIAKRRKKKQRKMSKIKCRSCNKELYYKSISDIPTFPFCSERCKLTDLGSWFDEERRIDEPTTNEKLEDYNE